VYNCLKFEVGLTDNSKGGIMILSGLSGLLTGVVGLLGTFLGGLLG
jgi:hypothetical protein